MDEALVAEVEAAASRDLPYDAREHGYRSAWDDVSRVEAARVAAVSPALARQLDIYTAALDELDAVRDEVSGRGGALAWGLPGLVEPYRERPYRDDDRTGYRFVLSQHPTRGRTVLYEEVGRFVERFEDGFREAAGPEALRSRMIGKSLWKDWPYKRRLKRWDEEHEGWHEVVWAWMRTEDIRSLLEERHERYERAVAAARVAHDYLDRPRVRDRVISRR